MLRPGKVAADGFIFYVGTDQELYQNFEKILTTVKKTRLGFCGLLRRMESGRIASKILAFQENRKT